jgi:hypothetical protein
MRQRFGRARRSTMARRPDGGFELSPRARLIGGWLAAALLIGGVAVIVGILGGNGDGASVLPSSSAVASDGATPAPIAFGTAIDPVTGEVASDARTSRFAAGDSFAYSVRPAVAPPTEIYVEVRHRAGDQETVQVPSPQSLAAGAQVIAFVVQASALIDAFEAGEFVMRIYADPADEPIAEGTFELVAADAEPSASP